MAGRHLLMSFAIHTRASFSCSSRENGTVLSIVWPHPSRTRSLVVGGIVEPVLVQQERIIQRTHRPGDASPCSFVSNATAPSP